MFGSNFEQPIDLGGNDDFEVGGQELNEIFEEQPHISEARNDDRKLNSGQELEINRRPLPAISEYLNAAAQRLGLSYVPGTTDLCTQSMEAADYNTRLNMKIRIKQELKSFDVAFERLKKRGPEKEDKEVMRPLYTYYRRVKELVKELLSRDEKNAAQGQGFIVHEGSRSSQRDTRQRQPRNSTDLEEMERKHHQQKLMILVQKLQSLGEQKILLKKKLQKFQEQFAQKNGRCIKYTKDLAPVESVYNQYKDLKDQISRLQRERTQLEEESVH